MNNERSFQADLRLLIGDGKCIHVHAGSASSDPLGMQVLPGISKVFLTDVDPAVLLPELDGRVLLTLTLEAMAQQVETLHALVERADLVYIATAEADPNLVEALEDKGFVQISAYGLSAEREIAAKSYASAHYHSGNAICQLLATSLSNKRIAERSEQALTAAKQHIRNLSDALARERELHPKQLAAAAARPKRHLSYRLGELLVNGTDTLKGAIQLPKALLREYREYRAERKWFGVITYQSKQAKNLMRIASQRGENALAAYVDSMKPSQKSALDVNSFGRYLAALANSFQFQHCVEAFETRYPNVSINSIHLLGYRTIRSYTRSLMRCKRAADAEQLLRSLTEAFPQKAEYYSLLGGLLTDTRPSEAREHLRTAINLDSINSLSDAGLLYRTLLLERLPLSEAWYEVSTIPRGGVRARGSIPFMLASMQAEADRSQEAVGLLNEYYESLNLAPIALIDTEQPFGMDNLHVPSADLINNNGPLVSVLMTTYNSAEYMDTAIRSVLAQTHTNIELIIVDDCSKDGTRQKLSEWAARDSRVRVFHNARNVGTYSTKNLGLLHAKGEFVTCHDSDDWSHSQKIERQLVPLNNPAVMASFSRWARIDERGYFEVKRWGTVLHTNPSSLLYRRTVVDSIGYYDAVRTGGDTEFENRIIATFGARAVIEVHACFSFGRSRSDSLTQLPEVGFDEFGASPTRQAYWAAWGHWHRTAAKTPKALFVDFPPSGPRKFSVPDAIAVDIEALNENVRSAQQIS